MKHTKRRLSTALCDTVLYFSKHMMTIFLDSDPLVRYYMVQSYTFAVFSAILFFRSAALYRTVPYIGEDHHRKDLQP